MQGYCQHCTFHIFLFVPTHTSISSSLICIYIILHIEISRIKIYLLNLFESENVNHIWYFPKQIQQNLVVLYDIHTIFQDFRPQQHFVQQFMYYIKLFNCTFKMVDLMQSHVLFLYSFLSYMQFRVRMPNCLFFNNFHKFCQFQRLKKGCHLEISYRRIYLLLKDFNCRTWKCLLSLTANRMLSHNLIGNFTFIYVNMCDFQSMTANSCNIFAP